MSTTAGGATVTGVDVVEHRMDDAADRRTRFTLVKGKGA
jgi:prephenate dehydratase